MKKFLSTFLALILLFSVSVNAASADEEFSAKQLKTLGILNGYEDGSLRLDNPIIRSEVAALAIRIVNPSDEEVAGEFKTFSDVSSDYWAYETVSKAYNLGLIKGYPDDTFKPLNEISFAEVIAIMVNGLKASEKLEGEWPMNYINKAKDLGIIDKADDTDPAKIITRGEMADIVWHTIIVRQEKPKSKD